MWTFVKEKYDSLFLSDEVPIFEILDFAFCLSPVYQPFIFRFFSLHCLRSTMLHRTDIHLACELDVMFSGFNTARKEAWLELPQLECASARKDSPMLLRRIRKSKGTGKELDRGSWTAALIRNFV